MIIGSLNCALHLTENEEKQAQSKITMEKAQHNIRRDYYYS